jgi:hypothetical protein
MRRARRRRTHVSSSSSPRYSRCARSMPVAPPLTNAAAPTRPRRSWARAVAWGPSPRAMTANSTPRRSANSTSRITDQIRLASVGQLLDRDFPDPFPGGTRPRSNPTVKLCGSAGYTSVHAVSSSCPSDSNGKEWHPCRPAGIGLDRMRGSNYFVWQRTGGHRTVTSTVRRRCGCSMPAWYGGCSHQRQLRRSRYPLTVRPVQSSRLGREAPEPSQLPKVLRQ